MNPRRFFVGRAIGFVVVLLVAAFGWYLYKPYLPTPNTGGVACTAEAMQCPDGSYVGRTGPNCEFVCPEATTTPPAGGAGEGIRALQLGH